MQPDERGDITRMLIAHREGDPNALPRLFPLVYQELRQLAHRQLGRGPRGQTLNTVGVVHEAYLKMVDQTQLSINDRGHFFAIAATVMRQVIVDHARRNLALKRGGDRERVELDEAQAAVEEEAERVVALEHALEKLGEHNPELVKVVECRFFAGLTEEETAMALGSSLRTVQRNWARARLWLKQAMGLAESQEG